MRDDSEQPAEAVQENASARKAVVYVTNANFLYPTVVSALQVEAQLDPDREDLLIFLMGVEDATIQVVQTACAGKRIRFLELDASLLGLPENVDLVAGHVPAESLGRLVLHRVLDPAYDRVLYLDGDTLVLGDIRPLLDHEPPAGTIGAVRDIVWLTRCCDGTEARDWWERYTSGIGLKHPDAYFNAGVLSFRRDDMQRFSEAALQFFIENSSRCKFLDQSALNSICNERVTELWPGFNYHVPYQELVSVALAKPALVHFTGPVKPWVFRVGRFAHFARIYDSFDVEYPAVAGLRHQAPPGKQTGMARWLMRRTVRQKLRFWSWFSKYRRLHAHLREFILAEPGAALARAGRAEKNQLAAARRSEVEERRAAET